MHILMKMIVEALVAMAIKLGLRKAAGIASQVKEIKKAIEPVVKDAVCKKCTKYTKCLTHTPKCLEHVGNDDAKDKDK